MILNIEPVAYILAFPVNRQGFVCLNVVYYKRYELFRELVGSIVV